MISKLSAHLGPTSLFSGVSAPSLVLNLDAGNTFSYTGTGSTWYDLTNLNNDISLSNMTFSSTYNNLTQFEGSFEFNGTDSFGSLISGTAIPLMDSHYTIESWFQANSYDANQNGGIIEWGEYRFPFENELNGLSQTSLNKYAAFRNYWIGSDLFAKPGTTSSSDYWYHLAFYWETHDINFLSSYPTYTSGTALTFNSNNLSTNWNIYPRKTYLQKEIQNYIAFDKTGVNDSNIYLFSKSKTNQQFFDGDYIEVAEPFRYLYPETFSGYGDTNSLANYVALNSFEYLPVVIATKNLISGNQYENGDIDFYMFFGKAMPQESVPTEWSEFENYPSVESDYDVIAKIILSYPSLKTSGTIKSKSATTYNLNNASIIYIERKADNFAVPPIGDTDLATEALQDVIAMTQFTRSDEYKNIYDKLAVDLIAPFSNLYSPFSTISV